MINNALDLYIKRIEFYQFQLAYFMSARNITCSQCEIVVHEPKSHHKMF